MKEPDTRHDLAINFLGAVEYLEDLLGWYHGLPHTRVDEFCERNSAPIGASRWFFLLTKAEEFEEELKKLKGPSS